MKIDEELVSVIDAAKKIGMRKQTLSKVIWRLGIAMTKQRNPDHRNQRISYIKRSNLEIILRYGSGRSGKHADVLPRGVCCASESSETLAAA